MKAFIAEVGTIVPLLTKLKGPVFYGYETKVLDEEKDILE